MKLNNRGWGLQMMLVFCLIFIFALIISAVIIEKSLKPNINKPINPNIPTEINKKDYQKIEAQMRDSAKLYQEKYYPNITDNDEYIVTLKTLHENNYINQVIDPNKTTTVCSGYVIFIKQNNVLNYKPYLKCGSSYTTNGYLDRLDI